MLKTIDMTKKLTYQAPEVQTTVLRFDTHLMQGSIEGTLGGYTADPAILDPSEEIWI